MKTKLSATLLLITLLSITLISASSCTDTDDGVNMQIQGTASSGDISHLDECINSISLNAAETPTNFCGEKYCFLKEGICLDGEATYKKLACDTQCKNGRCSAVTSLSLYYMIKEETDILGENKRYTLYIKPGHDTADYSEIYITTGFDNFDSGSGSTRSSSWSNHPLNRFPKEFEFDKEIGAYKIKIITQEDFSEFTTLNAKLELGELEFRIWEIPLSKIMLNTLTKTTIPKINYDPVPEETNEEEEGEEEVVGEGEEADKEERYEKESYEKEEYGDEEEIDTCNSGCMIDNKCYPIGYIKSKEYCTENNEFTKQKESDSSCSNNFECQSNLCISEKCISEGFLEKIFNWFKRFF